LGPLLWSIVYDEVLGKILFPGCHVVCYADTLLVAGGRDWREAIALGNIAVAGVVRGIKALGLEVAPRKTEAVFFTTPPGPPPGSPSWWTGTTSRWGPG